APVRAISALAVGTASKTRSSVWIPSRVVVTMQRRCAERAARRPARARSKRVPPSGALGLVRGAPQGRWGIKVWTRCSVIGHSQSAHLGHIHQQGETPPVPEIPRTRAGRRSDTGFGPNPADTYWNTATTR